MTTRPTAIDPPPVKPTANRPASSPQGFFSLLDALLRERERFFDAVFEDREVGRWLRSFLLAAVLLSAFYGLSMGLLGFRQSAGQGFLQMMTSAVKVPALFLLSTAVCFPVLYIVQVLMGARLAFTQTLALILMALTLNGVLLASCAPIIFFFVLTGSDYHFMKLLHVAVFGFSGIWSMMSLWLGLRAMCEKSSLYPPVAVTILKVWILVFAFVGTQMAWSLRPFVGSPDMKFQIFRQQESNFYAGIWNSITNLGEKATRKEEASGD